jgi:hypothetical protein
LDRTCCRSITMRRAAHRPSSTILMYVPGTRSNGCAGPAGGIAGTESKCGTPIRSRAATR